MGRRSTPDRIYEARRAAVLSRLVQADRVSFERAEGLVAGWEAEAKGRGLEPDSTTFWSDARPWIVEQLNAK